MDASSEWDQKMHQSVRRAATLALIGGIAAVAAFGAVPAANAVPVAAAPATVQTGVAAVDG